MSLPLEIYFEEIICVVYKWKLTVLQCFAFKKSLLFLRELQCYTWFIYYQVYNLTPKYKIYLFSRSGKISSAFFFTCDFIFGGRQVHFIPPMCLYANKMFLLLRDFSSQRYLSWLLSSFAIFYQPMCFIIFVLLYSVKSLSTDSLFHSSIRWQSWVTVDV